MTSSHLLLEPSLSLQIFWPLALNFPPSGAKPNGKFLRIFENHSRVGLLSLLQVKHSVSVQLSLLQTVSKSLTILVSGPIWKMWYPFVCVTSICCVMSVARRCASPYFWTGQGLWDCFFQLIWMLCFYWCKQRLHELFLKPCQAIGLFLAMIN